MYCNDGCFLPAIIFSLLQKDCTLYIFLQPKNNKKPNNVTDNVTDDVTDVTDDVTDESTSVKRQKEMLHYMQIFSDYYYR